MSQAAAAPSTGEPFVTGGKSAISTDLSAGKIGAASPSRRAVLTGVAIASAAVVLPAVASPPTDRMAWDRAVHEYRRLKLRMEAYYTLGPSEWVNEACKMAKLTHGQGSEQHLKAKEAAYAEEDQGEGYWGPVDAAALILVELPEPDLDAVAMKIQLHKGHLESTTEHDRLAWSCIERDLARLAA